MDAKKKGLWIGLGVLIGIGVGLMTFKNISILNVGHLEKLVINDRSEEDSE